MNANTEQYLKIIYALSQGEGYAKPKDLAQIMDVKAPTVTEKLKRMEKEGLVVLDKGVRLLPKGEELACDVLSTHRIWEVFLFDKLHMDFSEIHDEACELEHATSPRLKKLLYEYVGMPKQSPSGKPIFPRTKISLSDAKCDVSYEIIEIEDDEKLEAYLADKGLKTGIAFKVVGFDEYGGAADVSVGEKIVQIGSVALPKIYIKEI